MSASTMMELPQLPKPVPDFFEHLNSLPKTREAVAKAVEPYRAFENKLREIYAQQPLHPAVNEHHLVPLFNNDRDTFPLETRARDPATETAEEKEKYVLALPDESRRPDGSPAIVNSLKEFKNNFNLFSESSLVDMDWSNVIAAGSSGMFQTITSVIHRRLTSIFSQLSRLSCPFQHLTTNQR